MVIYTVYNTVDVVPHFPYGLNQIVNCGFLYNKAVQGVFSISNGGHVACNGKKDEYTGA